MTTQLVVDKAVTHQLEGNCIHHLFAAQANQRPDAIAVQFAAQQVTYAELDRRSNQLAQYLRKQGVGPDVYVSLLVGRSVDLIVSLLGILKAGGAYAPLDASYPANRLAFMMDDTKAPVVLTQSNLRNQLPSHDAKVVCIDDDWETIAREPEVCPSSEASPENLAYVNYTSGSTGRPKGVEVLHRGVARLVLNAHYADLSSDQTFLHLAPITFDASTLEIWGSLLNGAKLVVFPDHKPSLNELGQFIQSSGITTLWLTAGLFHKMVDNNLDGLSGVRQLLTGGDVVSVQHAKKFLQANTDCRLVNGYGPTENTTFTTCYSMNNASQIGSTVPIGSPIANTSVHLLNEDLEPVSNGEVGELYTGGGGLARGYLNQPELTQERFIPDPFSDATEDRLYKTGDLARYLPSGEIEFLGRADDQVKIRGYRVELEEIKSTLCQHSAVGDAVVVAREEPSAGEKQLVAYVKPELDLRANGSRAKAAASHVSSWQLLYDQLYQPSEQAADDRFNTIGWDSSYTGQPIPPEEMREWLDHTIRQILSLNPKRVLEIGCGTGLLLFPVAPKCEQYVGTDLSPVVVNDLQSKLAALEEPINHVHLAARPADNLDGIEAEAFDTVILNSVVQYFPSIDYLRDVLHSAIQRISPSGAIFIGDVRSFPLLEAFHTSVDMAAAPADTSCSVLRQRIRTHVMQEDELVIDPAFFFALKSQNSNIRHVEIRPKRGLAQNELSSFRYDVVLHVGGNEVRLAEAQWQDWQQHQFTLEKLRGVLEGENGQAIGIKNISNSRVNKFVSALELLSTSLTNVKELRDKIDAGDANPGVTTEDIYGLAASLGYGVQVSWSNSDATGAFDAVFYREEQHDRLFEFPAPKTDESDGMSNFATVPARGNAARKLVPELQGLVKESLPDYMSPSFYVLLDSIPLNANGKVDRKSLPAPDIELSRSRDEFVGPRDELEQTLVDIWEDALGVDGISIQDNFFDLGGSSLLAAELFLKIGKRFERDLPLAILAKNPTIEALSDALRDDDDEESWASLVPIRTSGSKPPLFCMHGGLGNVLRFRELSQLLDDDQPVYGLQWSGLDGSIGHRSIEEMAADYLRRIRTIQPKGPYHLAGHCVGGVVAYEMAQQLKAEGDEAAIVIMFDSPNVTSDAYRNPTLPQWLKTNWLLTAIRYRVALCASMLRIRSLPKKWSDFNASKHLAKNFFKPLHVWMCRLSGKRVPADLIHTHALKSMIAAFRRYRIKPYAGRVAYFYAGTEKVRRVEGFKGQFNDGMYGWRPIASDAFEFYVIPDSDHKSIVTDARSADIIKKCLNETNHSKP